MNKEEILQRKKRLLGDVLEHYLNNNDFPVKKKFRLTRLDDWDILDELERQKYFADSSDEDRNKYVLTLKGVGLIDNKQSKDIIKTGNELIPIFQKRYREDQTDNKYWKVDEILKDSKLLKEEIQNRLFFLKGLYLYINTQQQDKDNKYFITDVSVNERILKATNVEEFIKNHLEENDDLKPFFPKYSNDKSIAVTEQDNRIVAYLDVLGFKKISDEKLKTYFNKVIEILKQLKSVEGESDIDYVLISDSVVLSFPYEEGFKKLNKFLIALGRIQADLCVENIWLRGAVTIGKISIEKTDDGNRIVYGEALINAYELETKYAKFPRIIIDPKIFGILKSNRKELVEELYKLNQKSRFFKSVIFDPASVFPSLFLQDRQSRGVSIPNDGIWINYFEYIHVEVTRFRDFVKHLEENLYLDQAYFDKYKWTQNYALTYCHSKGEIHPYSGEVGECLSKLEAL